MNRLFEITDACYHAIIDGPLYWLALGLFGAVAAYGLASILGGF